MAKYDSHSSRSAAIQQEDAPDEFYRPAASARTRDPRLREIDAAHNPARVWAEEGEDGAEESEEDAFLRARRRVPVRRGVLPKSRAGRIGLSVAVLAGLAALAPLAIFARNAFRNDPRFRIDSSSNIQIVGNSRVSRQQLLSVFGSDIGRNIFFVPLTERQAELQKLPWVAHATVMRLLPNQLRVSIAERVPVAFLRTGSEIGLVDADGVLLNMPAAAMAANRYSFPVVTGVTARDPLPIRAARMRLYRQFIADLDSGGAKISSQLSEVDLSDPEDIRALLPVRGSGNSASSILVHFGDADYLSRYRRYRQHLADWLRQYPHLASVDLRFDNQVVLEMDQGPGSGPAAATGSGEAPTAHRPLSPGKPASKMAGRTGPEHASSERAKPERAKSVRAKSPGPKSPSANRNRRRGPVGRHA